MTSEKISQHWHRHMLVVWPRNTFRKGPKSHDIKRSHNNGAIIGWGCLANATTKSLPSLWSPQVWLYDTAIRHKHCLLNIIKKSYILLLILFCFWNLLFEVVSSESVPGRFVRKHFLEVLHTWILEPVFMERWKMAHICHNQTLSRWCKHFHIEEIA